MTHHPHVDMIVPGGEHAHLAEATAFAAFLKSLKRTRWFVNSKRPFSGSGAVLAYLSRYTHRVAISYRRLIAADAMSITFKVKDYRVEVPGRYTHDTCDRRVHSPLPAPRPTEGLPPHPPLRPPHWRHPRGEPGEGPQAAGRARGRGHERGSCYARCRVGYPHVLAAAGA